MKPTPPPLATRLLNAFLRSDLAEEVRGDLEEKFYTDLKDKSAFMTKLNSEKDGSVLCFKLFVAQNPDRWKVVLLDLMDMTIIAYNKIRLTANETVYKLIVVFIPINQLPTI